MKLVRFVIVIVLLHGCQAKDLDEHHISEIELPVSVNEKEKDTKMTVVAFEKRVIDFGEISDSAPATGEFVFENTGNFPVVFRQVHPSCNCTVPYYEKEVAPGVTSRVLVDFTPKYGEPGTKTYQHSTVEITGNFLDTIVLRVEAIVRH